jgi:hypothetical protein
MSKNPAMAALLAIAMFAAGVTPVIAQQQYTPAQILGVRPKCDDVAYTTPAPADVAKCNLEIKNGPGGGFTLTDGGKLPLRKFVDTDGDGRLDVWSFYKDGEEVYRETFTGTSYSFRWIGQGGMKWGLGNLDKGGKARIETWKMISAEETAQEAFQALATGDFERMKALFLTPQEMQALGLPAAETQKLFNQQKAAAIEFQKVRAAVPNLPKSTFSKLENARVGSYPADVTGGKFDLVKIPSGLIVYETEVANQKKLDFFSANEIVQVGNVWRLVDVPRPEGPPPGQNPAVVALLQQLNEHDKTMPAAGKGILGEWTKQRIQIVQKIAEASDAKERDTWYKQIPDNLATAIVDGDSALIPLLARWKTEFATRGAGGPLAAYATYRELWSTFQFAVKPPIKPEPYAKASEKYLEGLAKFVQDYPKADDAPDALIQIAMGSEFSGKEDEGKKWYGQIVANYADSANAVKAAGAIRRLDAVGAKFVLAGPTLNGRNFNFIPGKVTVVYYWASYSGNATGDFANLKKLQQTFGKDLDIVGVNLDEKAANASVFLQNAAPLIAEHVHQPGAGINGPLATYYGIFGLPHAFLIDRDGKVVNNKAQTNTLEDEISKLVKK